jgi:hypothetical protein
MFYSSEQRKELFNFTAGMEWFPWCFQIVQYQKTWRLLGEILDNCSSQVFSRIQSEV